MTDSVESSILEHLRHTRTRVDQLGDDMAALESRPSGLGSAIVAVKREFNLDDEVDALADHAGPAHQAH